MKNTAYELNPSEVTTCDILPGSIRVPVNVRSLVAVWQTQIPQMPVPTTSQCAYIDITAPFSGSIVVVVVVVVSHITQNAVNFSQAARPAGDCVAAAVRISNR